VPFVLAAGIAAFPLTAVESAALASIALLAEGWSLAFGTLPSEPLVPLGAFWLLVLVATVGGYASTSQLRLLEELVRQASRDPLTGCYRRESGKEFLDVQFLVAARHGAPLTVLFADLDGFKRVNDTFGHDEGDRVLASAAAALRRMVRESDLVLRWGGEEFVVVLPHTGKEEAIALLERLRSQGLGLLPDGRPLTISVGVAELLADGARSAEELVDLADHRMYTAKQAGRNRYADGVREPVTLLSPTPVGT
jgi:diguanylate cyclase (GGDEF)-like protein